MKKLKQIKVESIGKLGLQLQHVRRYGINNSGPSYTLSPYITKGLGSWESRGAFYENTLEEVSTVQKAKTVTKILPTDKIYFAKSSTYPRHKLRTFTENKRVIKIEKADKIVVPALGYSLNTVTAVKDTDGNIFLVNDIGNWNRSHYIQALDALMTEKVNTANVEECYLQYLETKYKTTYTKINLTKVNVWNSGKIFNETMYILDNYENVVLETDLEKYVSQFANVLDEEEFTSLNSYLKASDKDTISLGLRMLSGFSTDRSIVPIALLLLFNFTNVKNVGEWNSTTMKVIRAKLPFLQTLQYENHHMVNNPRWDQALIQHLTTITNKYVKTDEDRELIRKYGIPLLEGKIKKDFEPYLKACSFLNSFSIQIT